MTTTMTKPGCGCGCGGGPATPATFARPRFFAGQLLTEDDLSLLVDYVTGKNRLHNRSFSGPGVVCGLTVTCDPCGGGTVAVRPGHALDCRGNDIVVSCTERVDVAALVRELRVSSLGVECGDPCDDGQRHFSLYVRYEENPADPVTPFATEEPCPAPGGVPSRVEESFRFVVTCDTADDHRYNPGTRLLESIGPLGRFDPVLTRSERLGLHLDPMLLASAASARPIRFDASDAGRYTESLAWLRDNSEGVPSPPLARQMTEHVRALASAIARYDTHDKTGQAQIGREHNLGDVGQARQVLGSACDRLAETDPAQVWPDEAHRSIGVAVVAETRARVVTPDAGAPLEVRLLAQGTPISNVLQAEFRNDLALIREWLLGRLDRGPGVADCTLRGDVRRVDIPQPLPMPEPDPAQRLSIADLDRISSAAAELTTAVRRFVTDAACATLNPPGTDCTDTDVLLAHLEMDGCDVVRVCSATREQVLPGGSAYGEWLSKLAPLRHLAQQICCRPVPLPHKPDVPETGPVPAAYVAGLLAEWPRTGPLWEMWNLLLTPAPGETVPKPLHEQTYVVPSEVTDSMHEVGALRAQVSELTKAMQALRAQLDTAREQVSHVREELPDRLGERLSELEKPAPARRSSRARKTEPGESS
ncbi:hypothetical protein [Paractinoplanes atraurantiacus]|uniref:Uncharacterized protein n=1 Tax=Paractinoplanes atraurantiacus TaxID=1036182 RepID=A0A285HT16_9ACTN|nr:hypothetical protein [Actinoplanes atraurantiacus]SNY37871.1 hypothetical protein SAMN05421748_105153 [Actinoplanes atraurantiacus]